VTSHNSCTSSAIPSFSTSGIATPASAFEDNNKLYSAKKQKAVKSIIPKEMKNAASSLYGGTKIIPILT
jgi:hypothetical protein